MGPPNYHQLRKTMMRSIFAKGMDSLALVLRGCGLDGEQAARRHNNANTWLFACRTIDAIVLDFKSFLLLHA